VFSVQKAKVLNALSLLLGDNVTVVKIVELVGSSSDGWKEATENALNEAAKTIRNIKSIHLKRCTAKVENNKIVEYRAVVKIAFMVEKQR
jgi:flavin-binding protein dodecin